MQTKMHIGWMAALLVAALLVPTAASASSETCGRQTERTETRQLLGGHWERRAELYARDVPTGVTGVSSMSPETRGMGAALPEVDRIVTGKMTTLDYLDSQTRRFRSDGGGRSRRIPFVLTVPETDAAEVPVVLFGHGVKTSRQLVYLVANKLAARGYAAFAIDFPYHGARSICTEHADCAGPGWCTNTGVCRRAGPAEGRLRTIEAPEWLWPHGPSYPLTSGDPFLDLRDFEATRAHFAQAIVDMMQSVRVLRGADW